MSLFGNLFGTKQNAPQPAAELPAPPPSSATDPRNDPNLIRVFDKFGRELFITKEQWRTSILPGTLQTNWNNPDQLYGIIIGSLNDGFRSDVVAAAQQLFKIDPQRVRGACVWGIVLMEEGRLDEAERVFRDFMAKHGEDGVILTNLAKVYARHKDDAKAGEVLWHALELDPNQDNGVGWYEVIHRERDGEQAGLQALRRIAALPGSWRAQMWLARAALKSRDLETALAYYRENLSRAGRPVPTDLLMQMSGDLGNAGQLPELLRLTEPCFVAEAHGLQVGNNLIKAHLDLGQFEAARGILNQLYALKRPDWNESLSYWDTEIAKARAAASTVDQKTPMKVAMLSIEGPVWLKPSSPAAELFPVKSPDGTHVCFLGCSAEVASNSKRIQRQLADAPGRMSRALPLFLAEQVDFNSRALVQTLVPWITDESAGFVLSGVPWADDDAANYARQGQLKSDYVVITHLKTQAEPWTVELRLVRTIDSKRLGQLGAVFPSASPQAGIPGLAQQLQALLAKHAEVPSQTPSPFYRIPDGANFSFYLLRLEQLLAVRCSGMEGVPQGFLSGEREILDGNLQLCLACPQNLGIRVLLTQTLLAMKRVRADILLEFKDKLALLQEEHPLPEPAHSVVQRIINDSLAV